LDFAGLQLYEKDNTIKKGLFIQFKSKQMKKISISEAKQIDLVDYLASMGYNPTKMRGNDYWYHSPLRIENTASFKINRKANIWFDHGTEQGGTFIDFGILYHKCSVRDLLIQLRNFNDGINISFQTQTIKSNTFSSPAVEKERIDKGKIIIISERTLSAKTLLTYLEGRQIPIAIARDYCKEVDFMLYDKQHTAIGFRNDMGGYELRNDYFKGSSSPKTPVFIDNQSGDIDVFEGFFSLLSFRSSRTDQSILPNNFLILNSLAFFGQQRYTMEKHGQINLYLDRDDAGMKCVAAALQLSTKYQDQSALYSNHKDLNDWLVQNKKEKSLLIERNEKQNFKQKKSQHHGRI
jgi:hypothetical protein